ncbi:uncharacterized protein I206_102624 [Kwoniella pini CBS 10737]|uniref:Uncharacterized protein n=1 Tax=Kwoniella pini CBS 10737 TaxID=1296096 RepID=A0A1B9I5W4_9TREE|nr:uncharacterized protein I206_02978 [Kwoniella pini CBS 10737]OCF50916.1 hypothetical protein I206_02978 [Kwoniella pini CBS 10737]
MRLPYNRPWLIELADHSSCPHSIREGVQKMLTFMWLNRIFPFQNQAPYILASNVLERVINEIEFEDQQKQQIETETVTGTKTGRRIDENSNTPSYADVVINGNGQDHINNTKKNEKSQLNIIDFCSGAGGPLKKIEKKINKNRKSKLLNPIKFILSDLNPPIDNWKDNYDSIKSLKNNSISYIPYSVDATNTNSFLSIEGEENNILNERHLRTFFLSFHHFNEELARGVLVDAMRNSEGICIFELQQCNLRSMIMIAMLGPLTWLLTPLSWPSLSILIFTYIIPIIPLFLIIDGWISVYRTRSISHILRLTNLASLTIQLENQNFNKFNNNDKENEQNQTDQTESEIEIEWKWEFGKIKHTWPWGYMTYIIGRKKIIQDDEEEEEYDDRETEFGGSHLSE